MRAIKAKLQSATTGYRAVPAAISHIHMANGLFVLAIPHAGNDLLIRHIPCYRPISHCRTGIFDRNIRGKAGIPFRINGVFNITRDRHRCRWFNRWIARAQHPIDRYIGRNVISGGVRTIKPKLYLSILGYTGIPAQITNGYCITALGHAPIPQAGNLLRIWHGPSSFPASPSRPSIGNDDISGKTIAPLIGDFIADITSRILDRCGDQNGESRQANTLFTIGNLNHNIISHAAISRGRCTT